MSQSSMFPIMVALAACAVLILVYSAYKIGVSAMENEAIMHHAATFFPDHNGNPKFQWNQ